MKVPVSPKEALNGLATLAKAIHLGKAPAISSLPVIYALSAVKFTKAKSLMLIDEAIVPSRSTGYVPENS
jgi:hypothetical protein